MPYFAPSPLGPARPSVGDIVAAKPTICSLGRPFSFDLNQCPPNCSIRTMDAFRALQLMGGVSGVTLALIAAHVDGRDRNPRAAHVGHLTNGREDLLRPKSSPCRLRP